MSSATSLLSHALVQAPRPFHQLVENRHNFAFCHAQLSLFETREVARKVELHFSEPVLAIMLEGKKHMHMPDEQFAFLPGQSVIMQGDSTMVIDFPEAEMENPTRCLALEISHDLVDKTLHLLNEETPRADENQLWQMERPHFHFLQSADIYSTTRRLFDLYAQPSSIGQQLEYLTLQELVLRVMQTQARSLLMQEAATMKPTSRLAHALVYIDTHIHEEITVEQLADVACMSRPHFFRCFKAEVGVPPVVYIHQRKIYHACKRLANSNQSVSEIAYGLGFNNLAYFSRLFKKLTGYTAVGWRSKETPPQKLSLQ